MYKREYTEDNSGIIIPESYNGVALSEGDESADNSQENCDKSIPVSNFSNESCCDNEEECCCRQGKKQSSLFGNFLKFDGNFLDNIGTEEILILGATLILLFSKEQDFECILMLIILLFIK